MPVALVLDNRAGLVKEKEVIVAIVDLLERTPTNLPAEFEGFPVIVTYSVIKPHHSSYYEDLKPGGNPSNAFTLGAF
ncbi:11334_t:CDS:2 [Funneliformis mosseae]|uniref:11334_t:CDS:1 n=1 Tax=Funneliformis mosseae TaxID=27381 RepID=A0A9N9BI71_FUNMO|nr:11334_t:CDS:2 [Funneliformis mosseae]